jgi:hypothetical protein
MAWEGMGLTLLIAGILAMLAGLLAWPLWRRLPLSRARLVVRGEGAARVVMILGGAVVALLGVLMITFAA